MGVGFGYVPQQNYWNPGQTNGPGGYDYGTTPWGQSMLEQNNDVAYYRYGREMGIPDNNSAFKNWFNQQFPKVSLGYGAYTVSNPIDASIQGYLGTLGGYDDWQRKFMAQAPQLRGEDPSGRGGGPARWVGR